MAKTIALKPVKRQYVRFRIRGLSPLIQHRWSEKAKRMMLEKKQGRKTKDREPCDPEAEAREATYFTSSGAYGVPAMAIKRALIAAAHKDVGIEKTLVRKALFILCSDPSGVLAMDCDEPVIGQAGDGTGDPVRVGMGSTDLRYRPYFHRWSIDITCELDADLLRVDDLLTLVDRAGFGVGIGEWRPEKGGDYGRFEVDRSVKVQVSDEKPE